MRMKYFFVRINLKSLKISLKSRFKFDFHVQKASKLSCFAIFIQHLACVFGSLEDGIWTQKDIEQQAADYLIKKRKHF